MDPITKPKITAKDFFLHIGAIIALYVFATSFLSFMFDIINYIFPDRQAFYGDPYSTSMRFALSTLIVSFPLLLILLRVIHKDLWVNPAKRELALRKWLIYLTLFVTSLTVAIDLVILLNTFLGGEITARFLWKVVIVLVVAGGVFWTTLSDLRGVFFAHPKTRMISVSAASIIVIGTVIWGFTVIGSPTALRGLRDDNQRISDLQNIQWQVLNHYQTKGTLPVKLSDLNDSLGNYTVPKDPSTDTEYEYRSTSISTRATTTISFEMCATFAGATQDPSGKGVYPTVGAPQAYPSSEGYIGLNPGDNNWKHWMGRTCFERVIDPLKYPIYDKVPRG